MHIKAPINFTFDTRWSQCAKCRKVFGLNPGFVEGSHLICTCGQNLLLAKMTDVEFDELCKQYPQPVSPVMTTADKCFVHDGKDYYLACECPRCAQFRERAKAMGITPFELVQREATNITATLHRELKERGFMIRPLKPSDAPRVADCTGFANGRKFEFDVADPKRCSYQARTIAEARARSVSLTSPLAITMLMHFYANRDRFIPAPVEFWPPAQRAIVAGFKANGLIFERGPEDFGTTDAGSLIVATLKAVMAESLNHV